MPTRTKDVDAQVFLFDINCAIIIEFWQHGHGGSRGVDAATGFGGWHALHAMDAPFVFEAAIGAVAMDFERDFFVATDTVFAGIEQFDLPAHPLGIAQVHAVEVGRKQGRLVATFALAQFHNHAALVVGVTGKQQ